MSDVYTLNPCINQCDSEIMKQRPDSLPADRGAEAAAVYLCQATIAAKNSNPIKERMLAMSIEEEAVTRATLCTFLSHEVEDRDTREKSEQVIDGRMGTTSAGAVSLFFVLFLPMIGVSDSGHVGRPFCEVNSSVAGQADLSGDRGLPPDDGKSFGDLHIPIALYYDEKMFKKVGSSDKEMHRYVRAIMKTTQAVFDSEVMARVANITFYVVKIGLANYQQLYQDADAHSYLTHLSNWAKQQPERDKWQMAVLLTGANTKGLKRENVSPRDQLQLTGLANLGTICQNKPQATAVVEGRNFNSAYVLAHEIAHSFLIQHDGDTTDMGCSPDHHIMSPSTGTGKVTFSTCSAQALRNYLRRLKHDNMLHGCFGEVSKDTLQGFENLRINGNAGDVYNATEQCRFSHGPAYDADFTAVSSICPMLYCIHNFWQVKSHPALPGTVCGGGGRKRCHPSGKCLAFN